MKRFGCLVAAGVAVIVVLAIVLGFFGMQNGLVNKSETANEKLAQVETQYQKRYDLIPNLVKSVQGYMKQELAIFTEITQARAAYGAAKTVEDKAAAAIQVESDLSRLLVIVESNPEIKSDKVMIQLMDELASAENSISVARGRYNTAVRDYNTAIKSFPTNLIADMLNYQEKEYFKSISDASKPPVVDFG